MATQITQSSVAVIFEINAKRHIDALVSTMPVWVIESPENNLAVAEARKKYPDNLTVFFRRENESKEDMCSRVIYDLDDHLKFDHLLIYGAIPEDIDYEVVSTLNFSEIELTDYGCQLNR